MNEYFRTAIGAADVVWAYAGVRALYETGRASRRISVATIRSILDERFGEAPVLTVYGGKITTYRRLAEDALAGWRTSFRARGHGPRKARCRAAISSMTASTRWSSARSGPGGSSPRTMRGGWCAPMAPAWKTCCKAARVSTISGRFGADLTAAEVRYLMTKEWALTADDVLWRRSKLGLRLTQAQTAGLERFMTAAKARAFLKFYRLG